MLFASLLHFLLQLDLHCLILHSPSLLYLAFTLLLSFLRFNLKYNQLMNDKKRVLKQFEWFEVQTKVRQIIAEVIEPLQKKILANTLSLNRLNSHSEKEQKKVEYITLMVNNDAEIFNHGIFGSIEDKINQAKMQSKQLQGKVLHLEQFIDKKVHLMQLRLRESAVVLAGLRQFRQHVEDEISNQNNKLVQSQQNLFSNFDQINADITSVRMDIQAMKKQQATTAEKIVHLGQSLSHSGFQLQKSLATYRAQIKETVFKQERQALIIESLHEDIKRVDRFEKYTRQLQAKIQNLAIAVDNVEYKAEVIQPIVALTQINEYTNHILPPALRDNISIYYYNRYKQMVEEIISEEMDRGEKKQKVGCSRKINLQLMKQVHKRSAKCMFKLKKQKLAEKGIDIDSLPHDKKQELLNNLKIQEEFNEIFPNNTAPEKVDHTEKQTPEEYAVLRGQLINQLRERIQQELKDSKQYILNMQEEIKKEIEQLELKLENLSRAARNKEANTQLQAKATQQFQKNIVKQSEKMQKEMECVVQLFKDMCSVVGVHYLIEKQDQRDRLQIDVSGGRELHIGDLKQSQQSIKRNLLELSEKCLSCSSTPNYCKQILKKACLNYTSTPISLNNHSYERIELLDKMQNELAKINNNLNALTKKQETNHCKKDQTKYLEQKSYRYDSQIMAFPIKESRSNSHQQTVRNVASSQEMRYSKAGNSPRIINSSQMMENLMNKNLSRLFNHKRDTLRDYKQRKDSRESRQRSQFMMNVGSYFKQIRKQNEQFMK